MRFLQSLPHSQAFRRTASAANAGCDALLLLGCALYVSAIWFLRGPYFNTFEPALLDRMVRGDANLPFCRRVLVPLLLRSADTLIGDVRANRWMHALIPDYPDEIDRLLGGMHISASLRAELLLLILLTVAAFFGTFYFIARLTCLSAPLSRATSVGLSAWFGLGLPILFSDQAFATRFIYDPATLLLSSAAVYALVARKTWAFALVTLLAALNKETAGILLIWFLAARWADTSKRQLALQLGGLGVLYAAMRGLAVLVTAPPLSDDRWNQAMQTNWGWNAWRIATEGWLTDYRNWAVVSLCVLLLGAGWRGKSAVLRRLALTGLLLLGAYLYSGIWGEIRVFYEYVPIIVPLAAHSIHHILNHHLGDAADAGRTLPIPGIRPLAFAIAGLALSSGAWEILIWQIQHV